MKSVENLPKLNLQDALAVMDEDETELDKVLKLLLDPANIQHNTELSRNEITAFSILRALGKKYKLEVLDDFLKENLVLRVSKGRAGRKEWVKITSRQLAMADQNSQYGGPQPQSWRGRWFGGRR